jgi:hypothetical protein
MISFQLEPFMSAYQEAMPSLVRHYDEIAENKAVIGPIAPDVETTSRSSASGSSR